MIHKLAKLCFVAVVAWCLVGTPEQASAQKWAQDMFKEFEYDFGSVTKQEQPVHKFEFENLYLEDIRIREVVSSCGCTTVSVSKQVLKSREKGEVVCRFNSHVFDGFKQATVTVRFDAPFVGEVQLNVRGTIVTGVAVTPKVIDFGQMSKANLNERVIEISRTGNPNFRIVDVKSTFEHIGVSLREKVRGNGVVSYELKTTLRESVPEGFSQGELYVIAQDGARQVQIPVRFNAKVVSSLQVSPSVLTLSPVKPGEEVTRKLIIKADTPFQIVEVKSVNTAFRVRPTTEGQRNVHVCDVIYTGEDVAGRHECDIEFETDGGPALSAKIRAIVDIVPDTSTSEVASDTSNNLEQKQN